VAYNIFDGGGPFTPKNGWIGFLGRGRCESWHVLFCKCSGIHFNIHNNQPHVIDDTLCYEIRKQSTMSGGIAGRDIMRILGVLDAVAENSGIAITVC